MISFEFVDSWPKVLRFHNQTVNVEYGITPVMEFQDQGYKIRKIFSKKSTYPKEIVEFLRIRLMVSLSSLQKPEFLKLIILIFHEKKMKN